MMKIIYLYARQDKPLLERLLKHLSLLRREMRISEWSDNEILPGMDWASEIDQQLSTADIILVLLSANFLNSEDCYNQMCKAVDRLHMGNAHVIPVILSPVNWKETPVGNLQVLPREGRPITQWRPREVAFQDIAEGITKVAKMHLKKLREQKTSEEWLLEGNLYSSIDKYEDAFIAYDHALALDPTNAGAYNNKSWIFNKLERYEEALAMSEQALLFDPQFSTAYTNKIIALNGLGKHEETKYFLEQVQKPNQR